MIKTKCVDFNLIKLNLDPPKLAKWQTTLSQQPVGSLLALLCNAIQGTRPIKFQWLRNGVEIQNNIHLNRFSIDIKLSFSQFTLHDIQVTDSGNYSCLVSNDFGFDSQWSVLEVKGLIEYSSFEF